MAFHDLVQRHVRFEQILRPRGAAGQKPLHQFIKDGVHQVAALQRCDLQRLLRLGAGADAQHAGQKEAVGAYREILEGGGGEPAV